jgi:hypothetical protein
MRIALFSPLFIASGLLSCGDSGGTSTPATGGTPTPAVDARTTLPDVRATLPDAHAGHPDAHAPADGLPTLDAVLADALPPDAAAPDMFRPLPRPRPGPTADLSRPPAGAGPAG